MTKIQTYNIQNNENTMQTFKTTINLTHNGQKINQKNININGQKKGQIPKS